MILPIQKIKLLILFLDMIAGKIIKEVEDNKQRGIYKVK